MYRLIISERARDTQGRALEILGSYNPFTKELEAKKDRIDYWLSQGAQMSATVNNLLLEKKMIEGEKTKASIARKKKKAGEEPSPTESKAEKEKPTEEKKEEPKKEESAEVKADEPKENTKANEKPTEEKKEEPKAEQSKEKDEKNKE